MVDNWTLWLDLKILFMTVVKVLRRGHQRGEPRYDAGVPGICTGWPVGVIDLISLRSRPVTHAGKGGSEDERPDHLCGASDLACQGFR